jgi:hypothetical protein
MRILVTVNRGNCLSFRQFLGWFRRVLAVLDCAQNPCLKIIHKISNIRFIIALTQLNQNPHVDIENCDSVVLMVILYKMMVTMKELIYNNLF